MRNPAYFLKVVLWCAVVRESYAWYNYQQGLETTPLPYATATPPPNSDTTFNQPYWWSKDDGQYGWTTTPPSDWNTTSERPYWLRPTESPSWRRPYRRYGWGPTEQPYWMRPTRESYWMRTTESPYWRRPYRRYGWGPTERPYWMRPTRESYWMTPTESPYWRRPYRRYGWGPTQQPYWMRPTESPYWRRPYRRNWWDPTPTPYWQAPHIPKPSIHVYRQVESEKKVVVACTYLKKTMQSHFQLSVKGAYSHTYRDPECLSGMVCLFNVTVLPPVSFTCVHKMTVSGSSVDVTSEPYTYTQEVVKQHTLSGSVYYQGFSVFIGLGLLIMITVVIVTTLKSRRKDSPKKAEMNCYEEALTKPLNEVE
ncbi:uncharacterized protein LOC115820831 isoform X2 [Chanos chanos]|uniref:Uncharacterized protein LOC115820831 isoform X2 n=1 Tax=Chanos chanos TaxID=29144 RepID=A0A6J2W810_CHACN|nr:uncharacterized protein LOC115820831 isoform X2 [Chanos chanos]